DDLHAGLKHFRRRGLLVEGRSQAMNRHSFLVLDGTKLVDRFADHVHYASKRAASDGHGDRAALVDGLHAAHHAFSGFHRDTAHAAFAQVLLDLENNVDGAGHGEPITHDSHRFVDGRQLAFGELHIHRRPRNLNHMSYVFWHMFLTRLGTGYWLLGTCYIAAAPLTISIISLVIFACRARFIASVSESIMSVALLVAASIAVMRAACSAATDSNSDRKIWIATYLGSKARNSSSGGCS